MTIYTLTVTAMTCILGVLLLREKLRRTEAIEDAEVLREQFKDQRTIIENDRAEYIRAYNTLHDAGYTDEGHRLWTPPKKGDLQQVATAQLERKHRNTHPENRCRELEEEVEAQPDLGISDDWPPYGHGIETEAESGGES